MTTASAGQDNSPAVLRQHLRAWAGELGSLLCSDRAILPMAYECASAWGGAARTGGRVCGEFFDIFTGTLTDPGRSG